MMPAQLVADIMLTLASALLLIGSVHTLTSYHTSGSPLMGPTVLLAGSAGFALSSTASTLEYWFEPEGPIRALFSGVGLVSVGLMALGFTQCTPPVGRRR